MSTCQKHTPYFQHWIEGDLVEESMIVAEPRCRLDVDGHAWMFAGSDCINGLAHGRGMAVRLDGAAYVPDGRIVLGKIVEGDIRSLKIRNGD